jgi:hypothetical protein
LIFRSALSFDSIINIVFFSYVKYGGDSSRAQAKAKSRIVIEPDSLRNCDNQLIYVD